MTPKQNFNWLWKLTSKYSGIEESAQELHLLKLVFIDMQAIWNNSSFIMCLSIIFKRPTFWGLEDYELGDVFIGHFLTSSGRDTLSFPFSSCIMLLKTCQILCEDTNTTYSHPLSLKGNWQLKNCNAAIRHTASDKDRSTRWGFSSKRLCKSAKSYKIE